MDVNGEAGGEGGGVGGVAWFAFSVFLLQKGKNFIFFSFFKYHFGQGSSTFGQFSPFHYV